MNVCKRERERKKSKERERHNRKLDKTTERKKDLKRSTLEMEKQVESINDDRELSERKIHSKIEVQFTRQY